MKKFLLSLLVLCLCSGVRADLIKQSAAYSRTVLMTSSTDHITGATGLTLTVTESKSGAAFAASGATVTEIANGWYKIALITTDTNTLGTFNMHVTGAGADPTDTADQIVAFDPASSTNLGLSALPSASPAAVGGLITIGTGAGQLQPNGTTGNLPSSPGITTVASGTAQAGASTTITLAVGTGTTFATVDQLKGNYVLISAGTGAGQARTITGWANTTNIATVSRPWAVNPDSTSAYYVIGNPHPAIDSNLAVALPTTPPSGYGGGAGSDPWATLLTAETTAGTFGAFVKTLMAAGNVTVGGYATGQDPATLLLNAPLGSAPWNTTTVAQALKFSWAGYGGSSVSIVGNQMTIYAPDGTTALKTYTITPTPSVNSGRQ